MSSSSNVPPTLYLNVESGSLEISNFSVDDVKHESNNIAVRETLPGRRPTQTDASISCQILANILRNAGINVVIE